MWPVPSLANLVNKFLRVPDRPTHTGKPIKPDGGLRFRARPCRERLAHHFDPTSKTLIRQAGCSMREPEYA